MSASAARNGFLVGDSEDRVIGGLFSSEMWWRDHYRDIGNYGYRLRSRYDPDWQPSWRTSGKDFFTTEDGQPTLLRAGMDATRIRDGRSVMLKKVLPEEGPHELNINRLFSSSEHFRCHDNHCVPLLDVIELSAQFGSQKLMVFPLLRPFNQPQFQTFGEFTAFFTQICEGLRFMHQQNIAHGYECHDFDTWRFNSNNFGSDCTANNIMFDPSKMYPNGFQPIKNDLNRNFKGAAKAYTRTQRPPRYYFTNFGLSRQYLSRDALDEPLRDKSAPEHQSGRHCNPFHTDIYDLGNLYERSLWRSIMVSNSWRIWSPR
ncbi:hypothetical protein EI94DRAFT_549201 [Lactarius quietus]|nr:hypothetical protein EI94DRAFT_549201 [Lactarius quietus]